MTDGRDHMTDGRDDDRHILGERVKCDAGETIFVAVIDIIRATNARNLISPLDGIRVHRRHAGRARRLEQQ